MTERDNIRNKNGPSLVGLLLSFATGIGIGAVIWTECIRNKPEPRDYASQPSRSSLVIPKPTTEPTTQPTSKPASPKSKIKVDKKYNFHTKDFSEDDDVTIAARTAFGEARPCSETEIEAVVWTLKNRARRGKHTIKEVALAPKQYSCFNRNDPNREKLMNPRKYDPNKFAECLEIAERVLCLAGEDPTEGAINYYSPKGMRAIEIAKIKKRYESKIDHLKKHKAPRKVIIHTKRQYWTELNRAKTEEPKPPYWAPSMRKIGKIEVEGGRLSDHVFYKP
jgi:N-acetylmuramoyl-L-alanine amidase